MPLIGTRAAASAQGFSFTQIASAVDRLFEYVSLLLSGNGTNGAQNNTFLDSSTNNFTVTRNGNTTQGSFSPFGDTWSNYFDGSGDYLATPSNSALSVGTGAFTYECFVYFQSLPAGVAGIAGQIAESDTSGNHSINFYTNGATVFITIQNNSAAVFGGSTPVVVGQWYHLLLVRNSSGTTSAYVNGTRIATASNTTDVVKTSFVVGRVYTATDAYYGNAYISNLRLVKGTAVYDPALTTITIPTSPLTAITNTSLLTCQSNRFIDNSTNNFAITVNGNTSVQKFSPFLPKSNTNTWSNYFDGTNDQLVAPDNSAFAFGTGNFTIEAWVCRTVSSADSTIVANLASSADGDNALWLYIDNNNAVVTSTWFTGLSTSASNVVKIGEWAHIAWSRSGTTASVWVNGTRVSTYTLTNNLSRTTGYRVGAYTNSNQIDGDFGGYISNVRIVKGTAVYNPSSTTITVPTSPLTAISGTSLLTCQNSTIKDNSPNNFTLTVNGNVVANQAGPFATSGYFSGYFDGTGDSLTLTNSAALQLTNTGAFTIECWVYLNSTTGSPFILQAYNPASPYQGYGLRFGSVSGNFEFWDSNTWNSFSVSGVASTWFHLAVSYEGSGTTCRLFVNGKRIAAAITVPSGINYTSGTVYVGSSDSGNNLNGYISNLRIVKGTAVYTADFTPPAVPVLPITNTSLLLNFANAGIQDVAMINDIETVGNAQVSTTQSKFGGGSLSFDGSGDYLSIPTTTALNFGTANFTVECWAYFNSTTNTPIIWTKAASGITLQKGWFFAVAPSLVYFGYGDQSGEFVTFTVPSFSNGVWYHLAATRVGSTVSVFVNGTMYSSTLSGAQNSYDKNAPFVLGSYVTVNGSTSLDLNGYIDEFRITNGIARYAANFNPPPAPFKTY